jgi:F-type H+-transporting ATPase subunit delta
LEIRFDVETSLLGGVVVRVGDQVIDGSVKGKLDALAQTLAQSR